MSQSSFYILNPFKKFTSCKSGMSIIEKNLNDLDYLKLKDDQVVLIKLTLQFWFIIVN